MSLQSKVIKFLEAKGFKVINITAATRSGEPDLLGVDLDGVAWLIEIKDRGDTLKPLQAEKLRRVAKLGHSIAMVAWSIEDFKTKFDSIMKSKPALPEVKTKLDYIERWIK